MLYKYFQSQGNEVFVLTSDFSHFYKKKRDRFLPFWRYVHSIPYYKNLSITRLISHFIFAKSAFKELEAYMPELVYVLCPPNSLAYFAAQYKKKHSQTQFCLDLIDLWPETMPMGPLKKCFPFTLWRDLRNNAIQSADIIITECNLYQQKLEQVLNGKKTDTLFLTRPDSAMDSNATFNNQNIQLCYLGSINNIVDIDMISLIISNLVRRKAVKLHIIGDGEKRDKLIAAARDAGAEIEYYGKIFDDHRKRKIFDQCHFGLNIMKPQVCVGLTIKSIDYFEAGLPLLNNIGGDTWQFVKDKNIGFNITASNCSIVTDKVALMETERYLEMSSNAKYLFKKYFSATAFQIQLNNIFEKAR